MTIEAIIGFLIVNVVVALVVSVAANMVTPKVKVWNDQSTTNVRAKTIKQLNDEIDYITKLHNSTDKLIGTLVSYVLFLVMFLTLLMICGFVLIVIIMTSHVSFLTVGVFTGLAIAILGVMVRVAIRALDIFNEISDFENYIETAQKRIAELQQHNQHPPKD